MNIEITVMILRPADSVNIFRLGPNDFGVENIFDNYDELNLVIEGKPTKDILPAIKIVSIEKGGKREFIAVPIVESGEYRWSGKFIYAINPIFQKIRRYPIPLLDRRDINIFKPRQ